MHKTSCGKQAYRINVQSGARWLLPAHPFLRSSRVPPPDRAARKCPSTRPHIGPCAATPATMPKHSYDAEHRPSDGVQCREPRSTSLEPTQGCRNSFGLLEHAILCRYAQDYKVSAFRLSLPALLLTNHLAPALSYGQLCLQCHNREWSKAQTKPRQLREP